MVNVSATIIRTGRFYAVQFTGVVVKEGDRATWVSLEYAAEHQGKECDEAFDTSAFSITNSFGNSVDGG